MNNETETEVTLLFTASGQPFLIDADDVGRVTKHQWYFSGSSTHKYLFSEICGVRIYLHRFIANAITGQTVDHANGNTIDNRKKNLRLCTQAENSRNLRKRLIGKPDTHYTSQYRGVSFRKDRQRWTAHIGTKKERWCLGCYETEKEAAAAYNAAARKRYGLFATLNEIREEGAP